MSIENILDAMITMVLDKMEARAPTMRPVGLDNLVAAIDVAIKTLEGIADKNALGEIILVPNIERDIDSSLSVLRYAITLDSTSISPEKMDFAFREIGEEEKNRA